MISNLDDDFILISSPITYLNSNINKKILLIVDATNEIYDTKIDRDLSNLIVLRKSFNDDTFTDDMNKYYSKYYTNKLLYNLLNTTEKVICFECEVPVSGYISESYFSELLNKKVEIEDDNI